MAHREGGPSAAETAQTDQVRTHCIGSQQVSWWSVHELVEPLLTAVGTWPMIGTPAWCALASNDIRKVAAIFDAARHWALRVETCQEQRAEASRAISAAENWSAIASDMRRRREVYIPRKVAS